MTLHFDTLHAMMSLEWSPHQRAARQGGFSIFQEYTPSMENQATTTHPQKKSLISRKAWIVISVISLLVALSNASKSGANGPLEFLPLVAGGFIGGLLLLGGGWARIMGASRWLSRRGSVAATRK